MTNSSPLIEHNLPLYSMDSAPRDGQIILVLYRNKILNAAWCDVDDTVTETTIGMWPFQRKIVKERKEHGWRILTLDKDFQFCLHGNYGPITPSGWIPYSAIQIMVAGL